MSRSFSQIVMSSGQKLCHVPQDRQSVYAKVEPVICILIMYSTDMLTQ
jgi:hypothetical protein